MTVEPLSHPVAEAIRSGELSEGRVKKKDDTILSVLKGMGFDAKEAKNVRHVYKGNMLIDDTRGIVHIGEVIELVMDGFEQVINGGPLAREPCMNVMVRLHDCKLHEDSIHRGPSQVYPAVREAIRDAMAAVGAVFLEPMQLLQFDAPAHLMGELSKLVANKRGQLLDMIQEGEFVTVKAKLPVAEMFGLTGELRGATGGRGSFFVVDQSFEPLPRELQEKVLRLIKQRKGMS